MVGKFILSNNLQRDIGPYLGPYQIIYLKNERYNLDPDAICGSILLPPASIMEIIVDNERPIEEAEVRYAGYLHTREPLSFMAGILTLLIKGISVVLYIEDIETSFPIIFKALTDFLTIRYGFIREYNSNALLFSTEPMHIDQIYSDMFLFDYCDLATLINNHSVHSFNEDVQNKIFRSSYLNQPQVQNNGPIDPFVIVRGNM